MTEEVKEAREKAPEKMDKTTIFLVVVFFITWVWFGFWYAVFAVVIVANFLQHIYSIATLILAILVPIEIFLFWRQEEAGLVSFLFQTWYLSMPILICIVINFALEESEKREEKVLN